MAYLWVFLTVGAFLWTVAALFIGSIFFWLFWSEQIPLYLEMTSPCFLAAIAGLLTLQVLGPPPDA